MARYLYSEIASVVDALAELIEKAASVTPEEMEARRLEYARTHPPVNVPLLSEERLKELGF